MAGYWNDPIVTWNDSCVTWDGIDLCSSSASSESSSSDSSYSSSSISSDSSSSISSDSSSSDSSDSSSSDSSDSSSSISSDSSSSISSDSSSSISSDSSSSVSSESSSSDSSDSSDSSSSHSSESSDSSWSSQTAFIYDETVDAYYDYLEANGYTVDVGQGINSDNLTQWIEIQDISIDDAPTRDHQRYDITASFLVYCRDRSVSEWRQLFDDLLLLFENYDFDTDNYQYMHVDDTEIYSLDDTSTYKTGLLIHNTIARNR